MLIADGDDSGDGVEIDDGDGAASRPFSCFSTSCSFLVCLSKSRNSGSSSRDAAVGSMCAGVSDQCCEEPAATLAAVALAVVMLALAPVKITLGAPPLWTADEASEEASADDLPHSLLPTLARTILLGFRLSGGRGTPFSGGKP